MVASFREKNVVFGSVWVWAALAIQDRQKDEHKDIETTLDLILIIHVMYLICLSILKCTYWVQDATVDPEQTD